MRNPTTLEKLLPLLFSISKYTFSVAEESVETRLGLPIAELPELFSDDKLLQVSDEKNKCYPLLGCIQTLPINAEPQEPITLLTDFNIYGEKRNITVGFKPTKHCSLDSPDVCEVYPFDLHSLQNSTFNPKQRTVFVTKGYFTKTISGWQQQIKDLWKNWNNANVVVVGWPGGNSGLYTQSVANTKVVARQITVLLYYLMRLNNLELNDERFLANVVLVGHSLGAHISGFVGKDLQGKIGRITGLDPAGPSFVNSDKKHRLDRSDAQLVDIVHTNGGFLSTTNFEYGLLEPIGHIDFYANDGKHQPSCGRKDVLGCSHRMAPHYYITALHHQLKSRDTLGTEAVESKRLVAFQADGFTNFLEGKSIVQKCPNTALNEDSHFSDMGNCTIPFDFFASAKQYRDELQQSHNLDLTSDDSPHYKAYFYTSEGQPYMGDHGLVRVKANDLSEIKSGIVCDLKISIQSSRSSQDIIHKMHHHHLVSNQIVLPYLITSSNSSIDLALMDKKGMYLDWAHSQKSQLSLGIKKTFARLFDISSIKVRFGASAKKEKNSALKEEMPKECELSVNSITVQPLIKLNRNLVILYDNKGKKKDEPDIVVRAKGEHIIQITGERTLDLSKSLRKSGYSAEVFFDSVLIESQE